MAAEVVTEQYQRGKEWKATSCFQQCTHLLPGDKANAMRGYSSNSTLNTGLLWGELGSYIRT